MDGVAEVVEQVGLARRARDDPEQAQARLIVAGDVPAWERFFEVYAPWAYRFSHQHLAGNRAEAEDLCSEIMMAAARSIKGFDCRRGTLDLWMLGLARHCLAHFCRRRRQELPLVPEISESQESALSQATTDQSLLRETVNRALASLPARQASVLVGKYVSGYSVEELAQRTGSTSKAVESLLSRARAAFCSAYTQLAKASLGGESNE